MSDVLRPYVSAFSARFQQMLQYRAAAVAGFATQCWWGGIKVMVYAAFFHASAHASAPISLAQAITYTWLAQAFLALAPWTGDPDVALAVRTGAVSFDRLRPVNVYALWYARAAGWMTARAAPRALLMFLTAGIGLPLLGFGDWAWRPPASLEQAALFLVSMVLVVTLSSAMVMLLNLIIVATLTDRGANTLVTPLTIVLSGNLIPLSLFPNWAHAILFLQPFAGVVDIPFRIYFGNLTGAGALAGLAVQASWSLALGLGGAIWMRRLMSRLQVQGG
jgi:ABC-2 type transport system permease protein